jgi:hypothetical protein
MMQLKTQLSGSYDLQKVHELFTKNHGGVGPIVADGKAKVYFHEPGIQEKYQ